MSWDLLGNLDSNTRKESLVAHSQAGYGEEESKAATEAAVQAIRGLVDTGAFGEGKFQVIVSGHSNPDHTPEPGWSRDFIQIYIQKE